MVDGAKAIAAAIRRLVFRLDDPGQSYDVVPMKVFILLSRNTYTKSVALRL